MKIVSFGDSFTAGLGTDRDMEDAIFLRKDKEDINKLRNEHQKFIVNNSFTKYFADKLGVEWKNYGDIGCNNHMIVNKIFEGYIRKKYKAGDLVIVAFTSTLRNKLPWAPAIYDDTKMAGIQWSTQELVNNSKFEETKEEYIGRDRTNYWRDEVLIDKRSDEILSYFIDSYPKYFTENLYDDIYIDFYNQNMVLLLQKFFEDIEVDHIFIDAFDTTIRNSQYNRTNLINQNRYWGYKEKTIYSYLYNLGEESYLEKDGYAIHEHTPKHPSREGHKAFAEDLYKFYTNDWS